MQTDRRNLLRTMASAASAGAFLVVPRHVLGGAGYRAPSDKLNLAGIGIGGMGSTDLRNLSGENIVALCDVDDRYALPTFDRYPQARRYRDYRQLLEEQKELDAVTIATPDHTHAVIALAAMKAGKHVRIQKPMAHSVEECRLLAEAARKNRLATQMGIQGHADEGIRLICEWIWDGAIGEVRKVEAWCTLTHFPWGHAWWSPMCGRRPSATYDPPATLDWDLWLGGAPSRPYSPCYHPAVWRNWWDFGSGMLADRGCHTLDPVFTALKLSHPESVEAICSDLNDEAYPVACIVNYQFPARGSMPPLQVVWYDGLRPPRPEELEPGRPLGHPEGGALFWGDKGKIVCGVYGESPRLIPEEKMKSYKRPPKSIPRSVGHYQEWIQACRGGDPSGASFEYSSLFTEIIMLGNAAKRRNGVKLLWDGPAMRVTNDEEANRFLRKSYRAGWSLPVLGR